MGFFNAKHCRGQRPPLLAGRRLLYRGPRTRRLNLLRQFEVDTIYTFPRFDELHLPDEFILQEEEQHHGKC